MHGIERHRLDRFAVDDQGLCKTVATKPADMRDYALQVGTTDQKARPGAPASAVIVEDPSRGFVIPVDDRSSGRGKRTLLLRSISGQDEPLLHSLSIGFAVLI